MPAAHYRSTMEVDAIQYEGWDVNGPDVQAFLSDAYVEHADPDQILFNSPVGTNSLLPGAYVLRYPDGHYDQMSPADFGPGFAVTV